MKNFGICYLLIFLGCPGPVFFCAAHDFLINGKKFTLPDGFTIELVSKNSLIERPISCDFDHLGRLYVTESSGTNDLSLIHI